MKLEAQRIAIAEACGWHIRTDAPFKYLCRPGDVSGAACGLHLTDEQIWPLFFELDECGPSYVIPSYLTDLNAMHEAEKVLTEEQRIAYSDCTYCIARKAQKETGKWGWISLTAAQRAEAFLRTIGKWEDDK